MMEAHKRYRSGDQKQDDCFSSRFANMGFVAAFLVVLIHSRPNFVFGSFEWWVSQFVISGICTVAVPFFAFSAGYFMTGHCSEPGWYFREIRKRIRTLLVPYCFWNVACFFFYAIIAMIVSGRVVWIRDCLGINPFGLPEMPRLWFVRGLIVCVLLSPVLWKIANVGWMGIGLMYAVYVILCPGPEGAGVLHSLFRKGMFPLAMLFYFTMGMRFREKTFDLSVSPVNGVMCLTIGLVLIAAQAFCRYVCWGWAQYFGCLAIPLLMIGIWAVIPNSKWPDWLTRCAFPIYLVSAH